MKLHRLRVKRALSGALYLALGVTALMLAQAQSCFAEPPLGPRVSIASIDRVQLDGSGAKLDVMLDVKNPTGVDLAVQSLDFQCDFDHLAQANGKSTKVVTVAGNDHALIPVRLLFGNDSLMALASLLASGAKAVNYTLHGTAEIGPMLLDVPFSQQGRLALPH